MLKMMDQRKRLVLKQIVSRHIKSGEPVSSQTLLVEYDPGVSSATIRNDMHYLEEQGYIERPYCSAGRVPTEKGYRFFVDWLLELSDLTKQDQHALIEYYRFPRQELERLLRNTAFLLANVTGLVGFVLSPRLEETELEQITLAPLGPEQLLVVLVSNLGLIESQVLEAQFTQAELAEISTLLNERLHGKPLKEIRRFFELEEEGWIEPALRNSFEILGEVLARESRHRLYIEGLLSLMESVLQRPGGSDRLGVIKLLGDERRFAQFLSEAAREGEVSALIGRENPLPELHGWSVITMGYGYGVLGGLGPLRMDYSKAFSTTRYVGNRLRVILSATERKEVSD
jgi:heat-inducible transcriptional repressor